MDEAESIKQGESNQNYIERLSADLKVFKTIPQSFSILIKHFWTFFGLMITPTAVAFPFQYFIYRILQLKTFNILDINAWAYNLPVQIFIVTFISLFIELIRISMILGSFTFVTYLSLTHQPVTFFSIIKACWNARY